MVWRGVGCSATGSQQSLHQLTLATARWSACSSARWLFFLFLSLVDLSQSEAYFAGAEVSFILQSLPQLPLLDILTSSCLTDSPGATSLWKLPLCGLERPSSTPGQRPSGRRWSVPSKPLFPTISPRRGPILISEALRRTTNGSRSAPWVLLSASLQTAILAATACTSYNLCSLLATCRNPPAASVSAACVTCYLLPATFGLPPFPPCCLPATCYLLPNHPPDSLLQVPTCCPLTGPSSTPSPCSIPSSCPPCFQLPAACPTLATCRRIYRRVLWREVLPDSFGSAMDGVHTREVFTLG